MTKQTLNTYFLCGSICSLVILVVAGGIRGCSSAIDERAAIEQKYNKQFKELDSEQEKLQQEIVGFKQKVVYPVTAKETKLNEDIAQHVSRLGESMDGIQQQRDKLKEQKLGEERTLDRKIASKNHWTTYVFVFAAFVLLICGFGFEFSAAPPQNEQRNSDGTPETQFAPFGPAEYICGVYLPCFALAALIAYAVWIPLVAAVSVIGILLLRRFMRQHNVLFGDLFDIAEPAETRPLHKAARRGDADAKLKLKERYARQQQEAEQQQRKIELEKRQQTEQENASNSVTATGEIAMFRSFVTPELIQYIWVLSCIAIPIAALVIFFENLMVIDREISDSSGKDFANLLLFLGTCFGAAIALLVIRVLCEGTIIVFNIAASLRSIDTKMPKPKDETERL